MITLFIPYTYSNINLVGVIQTRINKDHKLDEGYLRTSVPKSKRTNSFNENYGVYLTYNHLNISTIMQVINEPDMLNINHIFKYYENGSVYVVY